MHRLTFISSAVMTSQAVAVASAADGTETETEDVVADATAADIIVIVAVVVVMRCGAKSSEALKSVQSCSLASTDIIAEEEEEQDETSRCV